jgi:hypothetical protein
LGDKERIVHRAGRLAAAIPALAERAEAYSASNTNKNNNGAENITHSTTTSRMVNHITPFPYFPPPPPPTTMSVPEQFRSAKSHSPHRRLPKASKIHLLGFDCPQIDPGYFFNNSIGQKRKGSWRANVVRFAPETRKQRCVYEYTPKADIAKAQPMIAR